MASLQRYKSHGRTYYRLVESYRKDGKPHIRVLAHLGKAEDVWALLKGRTGQLQVHSVMAGAVCALYRLAQELELASAIDSELPRAQRRDGLSVGQSLLAAILARACAPGSKRAFADWAQDTCLPDLLGFEAQQLTSQHFWDQMDAVPVECLSRIEEKVLTRLVRREALRLDACIYDTTNFYTFIATENERCELPRRGHNKQKRHDLRQLGLALVVDRTSQLPLFHHLYAGHRNDVRTLKELIAPIRRRLRKLQPETAQLTLVLDAGSNSRENLKDLPTSYVVVLRPSDQKKWLAEIASQLEEISLSTGEVVRAYRQRRTVLDKEREVVVVFSLSLYQGQLRGLRQHLEKAGQKLEQIGTWSRYKPLTLEKRLQRLLDRPYLRQLIRYELDPDPVRGTQLRFWSDLEEYRRLETAYFGLRVLASDRQDWSTAEIIEAHRSQPRAESSFRDLKNPVMIATRPQFHWTDQKLRVHAFLCVMAYLLVRLLWWRSQRAAADCPGPARLLAQLKRIRLARIVELSGKPGRPRSYLKIEHMDDSLHRLAQLTGALPQI